MSIIVNLLEWESVAWQFALVATLFVPKARERAGAVHQELWLLAPAGLVLTSVEQWHGGHGWYLIFTAINLWLWWHYRNAPDDENRWKRRGKKTASKVAEAAGKLVVVPATSGGAA